MSADIDGRYFSMRARASRVDVVHSSAAWPSRSTTFGVFLSGWASIDESRLLSARARTMPRRTSRYGREIQAWSAPASMAARSTTSVRPATSTVTLPFSNVAALVPAGNSRTTRAASDTSRRGSRRRVTGEESAPRHARSKATSASSSAPRGATPATSTVDCERSTRTSVLTCGWRSRLAIAAGLSRRRGARTRSIDAASSRSGPVPSARTTAGSSRHARPSAFDRTVRVVVEPSAGTVRSFGHSRGLPRALQDIMPRCSFRSIPAWRRA